jgi:hypothetical protein
LKSQIFDATLEGLHQYLKSNVVKPYKHDLTDIKPIKGSSGFFECDGLIYQHNNSSYQLYDKGAVFDEVEGRVVGDHYATSHYALMCAALYLTSNNEQYLKDIVEVEDFCLRQLQGYPRVPWGMHLDFNNYAIAWTYELVGSSFSTKRQAKWKKALLWSPMNRHKVGNWWGQRSLYSAFLQKMDLGHQFKSRIIDMLYKKKFIHSLAADGCFEDKVGRSRPIQYHAFSLGLALALEHQNKNTFAPSDLSHAIDLIKVYLAPDGDYNFFGRGHKQIFAYSPAIFCLLCNPTAENEQAANTILKYVEQFQLPSGDFPLVLSANNKASKVGWYDYHRHSVYNAFFGAWLALAKLQLDTHMFGVVKDQSTEHMIPRVNKPADSACYVKKTSYYFAFLSDGYDHYGSECAVAFHKLYITGLGDLVSCPGGPRDEVLGFGSINKFDYEAVNYFAPLIEVNGVMVGPGKQSLPGKTSDEVVSFKYCVGNVKASRYVEYTESTITIKDSLTLRDGSSPVAVRLFNLPLNIHKKELIVGEDSIQVRSANGSNKMVLISIEGDCDQPITAMESYPWVDGDIQVFSINTKLQDRIDIKITIKVKDDESTLL